MTMPLVVTIDGPAASGKSTLAQRLAQALGLPFLDTGLLYRAVGRRLLEAGGDPRDTAAAIGRGGGADRGRGGDSPPARPGDRPGSLDGGGLPGGPSRPAPVPAPLRRHGWRGRAGRARYRHGGLPGGRGQAVRDRELPRSGRGGATRSCGAGGPSLYTRPSWPSCASVTAVIQNGRSRHFVLLKTR